jgi:AraC family transcriptional regulator, transcriptional activator FtrA
LLAGSSASHKRGSHSGQDPRTFYREFHAATGTTPHRWLIAQRIILARRLLGTTRLSVTEIAQQSGFDDISVFRRHFTSQAGVSPTIYRRRFGQLDDEPGMGHEPGKSV